MKNLFSLLALQAVAILSLQAQPVSNYNYKLDNGINIKTENCWNQVWVEQSFAPVSAGDKTAPLSVNIRTLGDLISQKSFKLLSAGKEVRMLEAASGTYDLKLTLKLSGKPGTLSFSVGGIIIKPKTKTSVSVTLYDYQVLIEESPASLNGLSYFESKVNRYKGNSDQNFNKCVPVFYIIDKHDKPIPPSQPMSENSGKIKPGTYDLLISIGISGRTHKVWLEDFVMKPDVNYKIAINLNAGIISYSGGNKEVKDMHLYPAGTAGKQAGTPAPVRNLEIIGYESPTSTYACPPGTYDALLTFGNGIKYEWRKNIIVKTGAYAEVK